MFQILAIDAFRPTGAHQYSAEKIYRKFGQESLIHIVSSYITFTKHSKEFSLNLKHM